jgi:hypothetical protein
MSLVLGSLVSIFGRQGILDANLPIQIVCAYDSYLRLLRARASGDLIIFWTTPGKLVFAYSPSESGVSIAFRRFIVTLFSVSV